MVNQRKIFINSEADNFYKRNIQRFKNIDYEKHKIILKIKQIIKTRKKINLLEIGCSDAGLIDFIDKNFKNIKCFGIDPSSKALDSQKNKNLTLKKATAEKLPFKKNLFDIIIYNFCLYLCDTEDLIKIVSEADRVIKDRGFVIIYDFYFKGIKYVKYIHRKNIFSRKMNYGKLFTWHPKYNIVKFYKFKHQKQNIEFKNNKLNTTAIYLIEKKKILKVHYKKTLR